MKFEHAATPFTYTLYTHTGSLHKKFKNRVENSLLPPLFFNPPTWANPPPLSRQYLQTPPPPQNQMVAP